MLKRYSQLFVMSLVVTDLVLVSASWLGAYWLRFHTGLQAPGGVPPLRPYVVLLLPMLPLWLWLFRTHRLYEPRRTSSPLPEVGAVLRATTVAVLVLVALSFFSRHYFYSRGVILLFYGLSFVSVSVCRVTIRSLLRRLRRRGFNLRYVLMVGGIELAGELIDRIHGHPETGLRVVGLLTDDMSMQSVRGVRVVGRYDHLKEFLGRTTVDEVILALPHDDAHQLEKVMAALEDEVVSVRLVPDLLHVMTLRSSVEELDGIPVISLRDTPLVGWASVQKRVFDLAATSAALTALGPLMLLVAAAIRVTSGSPVLYAQERMGLDGRVFRMLKFRTMRRDAEGATGPVWTRRDDERRTRLGRILRRLSLDELPQLWNVLRGEMSLVGPRPERPVFIERFRREIPGYMLRHKVKAGLTGWAQVHGWRGNTSLHERVEHDIYYIQNWSLGLDVRILLKTLWIGFFHRNAY